MRIIKLSPYNQTIEPFDGELEYKCKTCFAEFAVNYQDLGRYMNTAGAKLVIQSDITCPECGLKTSVPREKTVAN